MMEGSMHTEFDITLTSKDMYRFAIYHAYTGSQGIISILIAALCFFVSVQTRGSVELMYTILYAVFGAGILVYCITVWMGRGYIPLRMALLRICRGTGFIRWFRPGAIYWFTAAALTPILSPKAR